MIDVIVHLIHPHIALYIVVLFIYVCNGSISILSYIPNTTNGTVIGYSRPTSRVIGELLFMRYFQEILTHLHSVGKAGLEMVKYVEFGSDGGLSCCQNRVYGFYGNPFRGAPFLNGMVK